MPALRAARLTAAVAALLAAGAVALATAAPAAASPRLVAANALDRDRDGSVDTVVARFSGKVKGKPARRGPFAFAVKGYSVTAVTRARGKRVRIAVAETGACDAGLRPTVTYRPRGRQRLKAGRRTVRRSRVDMARRDRRPPRITCAATADDDGNGRIDRIVVAFSRPVRSRARRGKRLPFAVDRHVVERADRARGREIVLHLREKAAPDGGDVPAILYRAPRKARQGVRPRGRGRAARSSTFNGTRDRVRPLLLAATTVDGDGDGRLDAIAAHFSEPIRAPAGAVAVAGARAGASTADGATLVTPIAGGPGGGERPATTWGAGEPVRDLAGNPAERTERTPADGAAPVIVAARTADRGGKAGHLDTVEVTFSEPVTLAGAGQPFGVTGYAVPAARAAGGARIDVTLAEAAQPDSGARPAVGYVRGRGAAVRDAAGNEAAGTGFGGVADGVGPRLVAATTADTDLDGRLDAVRYRFSEPVRGGGGACPGCGFAADGLTATGATVNGGAEVTVAVATAGVNSGARPLSSYGPALGGTLADTAGNPAGAGSVIATDGAAPVAIDVHTDDLDADPTGIDAVVLTFAEPVSFAGDSSPPYSFAAAGYTVASVDEAVGKTVTIRLDPSDGPDTGSAPTISYSGGGGVALTDANGVPHAARAYAGLTRDAVPPAFVAARTADRDAVEGNLPGKLDAVDIVYSEEVTGTADPAAFNVGGRHVHSVAFGPDSVQVRIDEVTGEGVYDTGDDSLEVTYLGGDPAPVTDLAEGLGDEPEPAPSQDAIRAEDGAGAAIVAAVTGDDDGLSGLPDGAIDRVDVDFSEPVSLVEGEGVPLALGGDLVASSVAAVPGEPTRLTVAVEQEDEPNGGKAPSVEIVAPARILDGATPANAARDDVSFTDTADGVGPALIEGRGGQDVDGACAVAGPGVEVDCVRAVWSEPVLAPLTTSPFFDATDFTLGSLLLADDPTAIDIALDAPVDRDEASELIYAHGEGGVTDIALNPALDGMAQIQAACPDPAEGGVDNDVRSLANPLLTASLQRICAGDDDWFRVTLETAGDVSIAVNPVESLDTVLRLVDGTDTVVADGVGDGPGAADVISVDDLPAGTYWLHVKGAEPEQEGDYCVDPAYTPGEGCEDGDVNPT